MDSFERRIGSGEILERLARLEEQLLGMREDIGRVNGELKGHLDRIHRLANTVQALQMTGVQLEAAREALEKASQRNWTRREKLLGLVVSLLVIIQAVVSLQQAF